MVYNYTKPRGPIAAMYSSPGPCYGLPGLVGQRTHDPRSGHSKAPSFPFGVRHGKFSDDCSPGPCYFPSPKVNRDGQDGTPHYSLYSRQRDSTQFKTPGPGAYKPESVGQCAHYRHPAYSFGIRNRHRRIDESPAPNKYQVPAVLGKTVDSGKPQAPQYSMSSRFKYGSFHDDVSKTPGPGTYKETDINAYKSKQPLYSMTSRNVMPGDATKKPGPGAHSPENVWMHKRQMPISSFGIRHSEYLAPLIVDICE